MIIVASGPTAAGFLPPCDVKTICVNGVIQWIGRTDYWFTLDCTPKNIRNCRNPRRGVSYVAALPERYHLPSHVARMQRITAGDSPGLSELPGVIHSGNSAFGALGLAYHLGAKKVVLVGVDGTDQRRVEGGRSGNLSHLPALFQSALGQIEIVNCGKLDAPMIPKMTMKDALEWVRG